MEKTEEMQDLFKRRVSEKAQKIISENERSVLREIYDYMHCEYYKEDIKNQIETSSKDKLTEKSVRKIAERLAYDGEEDSSLSYWDNIDLMIDKYGETAKYELTNEKIEGYGHTLHRIRALKDFGDVKAGDLGGFLESEYNLSHEGNCWVYDDAIVYEEARIYDNAKVYGDAWVYSNAEVYGDAEVYENARVYGNAEVSGDAKVHERAMVAGRAKVYGNVEVTGRAGIDEGEISKGIIDGSKKKNIELD